MVGWYFICFSLHLRRNNGKTSLLFQFAINSALECSSSNRKVVFICNRRRLETKPPYLSQGIDPSSDIFQGIKMKYVDDEDGIKKYFAAFHLNDTFPAAVIVDDFGDFFDERYFNYLIFKQPIFNLISIITNMKIRSCQERYGNTRGRDLAMVRTLALCHNATIHANKKGSCKLLLSDTHHGDSPRLLFIYKRWIPTIFTVKGDGSGSFLLKYNNYSGNGSSKSTKIAKYSIAFQYLLLEGITEDGDEQ
ncbi:uncharacterized protein LOC111308479 isoform X2 [Durio zibethinus]|uniref:Uncharacterized protein LOC111308479 isoform X2 n=1 Tax=Durio zibethinus TaxID=66656 RepID=A0A6P6ACK4_DURZI|nr:uncharacterized protein LOC111308479 isoform X2 [Durio zibethinus]